MRIFISHSSHDAEKAAGVCSALERDGHSCFIAPRDIRPGREYAEEIVNGICGADVLLLLLSEQANQSPHVLREVERAGSSRIPIVVYKLEEVALTKSMEYFLMTNQWIDGTKDSDYRKVTDALQTFHSQSDVKAELQTFQSRPDSNMKFPASQSQPDVKADSQGENLPERELRKKAGRGISKALIPALVLVLAVCGIVFAVGKAGQDDSDGGESVVEQDAGRNNTDSEALAVGGRESGAESGTQDAASRSPAVEDVELSLGVSVELGTYNDKPVIWRVLHVSEDGEQLILVSDKILTMKAFDAPESGKYNSDGNHDYWTVEIEDKVLESHVRGSNLWCDSNIRVWLNSEKENVTYEDQPPAAGAMSEKKNGYSNEAGFLHGFTKEELAVLREMQVLTIGNVLMDSWGTETKDRVFLLSEEELKWFDEADVSLYTAPTENAVEQDQTGWYEGYSLSLGVEEYLWLLRDPGDCSTSQCMAVGNGRQADGILLERVEAGAEGFGIRPAICVDRQALAELIVSK